VNNMETITDEEIKELVRMSMPERNTALRVIKNKWSEDLLSGLKAEGKEPILTELNKVQLLEYMNTIKQRIKKEKGTVSGTIEEHEKEKYQDIIDMNIYNNAVKINYNQLIRNKFRGKIIIRNPRKLEESQIQELTDKSTKMPEAFYHNVGVIISTLDDLYNETEHKKLSIGFPINKYLGAIDVSKKDNRLAVYQYWEGIAKLYPKVRESIEDFFEAIDSSKLEDERKEKFKKLYDKTISDGGKLVTQLEYIAIFEDVEANVLTSKHRFYNLIIQMMNTERLGEEITEDLSNFTDDKVSSEGAEQVWNEHMENLNRISDSGIGRGDALDMDKPVGDIYEGHGDIFDDMKQIVVAADPLLAYENVRNTKLLGILPQMTAELEDELKKLKKIVDDDATREGENQITVNSSSDVGRWMRELHDTSIIDEDEKTPMALPISVLTNTEFGKMYNTDEFMTVETNTKINLQNIDAIKTFFGDLHDLLRDKEFRGAIGNRSTKGANKTGVDYREAQSSSMRGIFSGKTAEMSGKGDLSSDFNNIKGKLQNLLDAARDYYFDPIYSGLLPIAIPQFGSSIGAKVLQMLSKDLGMETIMSSAYDNLFQTSASSIDADQLNEISDFLKKMFLPSIEITTALINSGEDAANALTNIFGESKKEINNNYCASLIVHFMEDTGDMNKIKQDFNSVPIGERAEAFDESYNARKAIPMFAMPHWLDMNQGVLTSTDELQKEYEELKNIFESVQTDLSVLLHKLLKAHDAVRSELNKPITYGYHPLNTLGIDSVINKMQIEEDIDLSHLEVEQIVKAVDSHKNISEDYGISGEQVYLIKANFR
tara:strand:- start:135 stop:2615 length:2481 start_codon:yes stop_codon:yes gene_type:complete